MKKTLIALLLCAAVLALAACGSQTDAKQEPTTEPAAGSADAAQARPIDLDLSGMSGTVVYSQVYAMLEAPEDYLGQRVRMKGTLNYYRDPDTEKEYFAALIADATACCAQGIEFVWKGEHRYPDDYPPLETEVTVTGTFDTYDEDGYTYVQLIDADVTWA